MQSTGQHDQWPDRPPQPQRLPSPTLMTVSAGGPLDPRDYYRPITPPSAQAPYDDDDDGDQDAHFSTPPHSNAPNYHLSPTSRSFSQSPERSKLRPSHSVPGGPGDQKLNSARSSPAIGSCGPGNVKDMAGKLNRRPVADPQLNAGARTGNEKYRRPVGAKANPPRAPASPTKADPGLAKLQKRRNPQPKSPQRSPETSFETNTSFSSAGTLASARSQPSNAGSSSKHVRSPPRSRSRPLFGEITPDGQWNGDFDLAVHGSNPAYAPSPRRGSESNAVSAHRRTQSHTEAMHLGYSPDGNAHGHRRSRSDVDAFLPSHPPSLPLLDTQSIPRLHPSQSQPAANAAFYDDLHNNRTSSRARHKANDSGLSSPTGPRPQAVPAPTSTRPRLTNPSAQNRQAAGKENDKPPALHSRRYNPPSLVDSPQYLSAKVVAPPPRVSPPLRSSRPRQPVSSATTAASRARAAGLHQNQPTSPSSKRPSEQWLGKPYDPRQERSRRRIPELDKVDFAERRARIQKAISQNLEDTKSWESLQTQSRRASENHGVRSAQQGALRDGVNSVDQKQADWLNDETDAIGSARRGSSGIPLSVETSNLPDLVLGETSLNTAGTEHTEFEFDESPVLTQGDAHHAKATSDQPDLGMQLLTSATYQAPKKRENIPPLGPSLVRLDSPSDQQSPSADDSPSDLGDRWGLGRSMTDQGSIRIMLDDGPALAHHGGQHTKAYAALRSDALDSVRDDGAHNSQHAPMANGYIESPITPGTDTNDDDMQETPRPFGPRELDVILRSDTFQPTGAGATRSEGLPSDPSVLRAIDEYRATGVVGPELLEEAQRHTIDLNRISANGGSDAMLVQNLLDSIAAQRPNDQQEQGHGDQARQNGHEASTVTSYTPPDALHAAGTATLDDSEEASYQATSESRSHDAVLGPNDEDDFAAQIRKADEQWERQQHGEDTLSGAEDGLRPTPPPKDVGYTPRSSVGQDSTALERDWSNQGLSITTSGQFDHASAPGSAKNVDSVLGQQAVPSPTTAAPPLPTHAPPPPPLSPQGNPSDALPPFSEQSNDLSPRLRKNPWGPASGSSRPSTDSQRQPPPLPASQSMSSFAESSRQASSEIGADGTSKAAKAGSPSPEQKRLQRRRHIIRELLDTEYSYHQDLKIIEDIYKATVSELVTPEDKKTLFGNCDDIERFSLKFYDQLRKAAVPVYAPSKGVRWGNRRGSMSTTQSDATGPGSVLSSDAVDEERDRTTFVGKIFLDNLQRMEMLYGAYLKNHDAANQRLSSLQSNPTVKCWLEECHNNASDITSAWDLDSLLVKPTQRVSKYPLILQQLLETTPTEHPDHEPLKAASKDSVAMLTRINEAKKRADLVEQMISGKRRETDMRSGLAKAFGRRTERLKERVGINEAFQDPDFDALAQQFGGHYIRLQISMRDVQDYVNRVDKAVEQVNNYAAALELFTDVLPSSLPEIESKWRRYGQTIRELTAVSLVTHKFDIHRRVIAPMITLIKIHVYPQAAIHKRKKRVVDYARCKSIEKRGEKPDKKTLEASEMYEALNDQLKIELPKLYELTGKLVRDCLKCFLEIQLEWQKTWERKLRPLLDASDVPQSIQDIAPAFTADYELVKSRITELALCNGSALADSANFLSPTATVIADSDASTKRPSTLDETKRAMSMGSDASASMQTPNSSKRQSGAFTPEVVPSSDPPALQLENRLRSVSSMSNRGTHTPALAALTSANRPWSNSNTTPPTSAYPISQPSSGPFTSSQTSAYAHSALRSSANTPHSSRPGSSATYVTARPDPAAAEHHGQRFSGIFSSAMPLPDTPEPAHTQTHTHGTPSLPGLASAPASAPDHVPVLFVCASLFEFNIDKARKEAGYPYLTYDQGEVFDVVAQKGELWLAKNQDDQDRNLGWIWEQHFVILSAQS